MPISNVNLTYLHNISQQVHCHNLDVHFTSENKENNKPSYSHMSMRHKSSIVKELILVTSPKTHSFIRSFTYQSINMKGLFCAKDMFEYKALSVYSETRTNINYHRVWKIVYKSFAQDAQGAQRWGTRFTLACRRGEKSGQRFHYSERLLQPGQWHCESRHAMAPHLTAKRSYVNVKLLGKHAWQAQLLDPGPYFRLQTTEEVSYVSATGTEFKGLHILSLKILKINFSS